MDDDRIGRLFRGLSRRTSERPCKRSRGIGDGVLIGDFRLRQPLHADAEPRLVHHHEHGVEAAIGLADKQAAARRRNSSRRWRCRECPSCARCEPQETPLRAPSDAVGVDRNFGTMNSEMPLTPAGAPSMRASTRWTMFSARSCSPAEMKIFWPVMRIAAVARRRRPWSSAGRDRCRNAARSDSSCRSSGLRPSSAHKARFCSSEPCVSSAASAPWVRPGYMRKAILAEAKQFAHGGGEHIGQALAAIGRVDGQADPAAAGIGLESRLKPCGVETEPSSARRQPSWSPERLSGCSTPEASLAASSSTAATISGEASAKPARSPYWSIFNTSLSTKSASATGGW